MCCPSHAQRTEPQQDTFLGRGSREGWALQGSPTTSPCCQVGNIPGAGPCPPVQEVRRRQLHLALSHSSGIATETHGPSERFPEPRYPRGSVLGSGAGGFSSDLAARPPIGSRASGAPVPLPGAKGRARAPKGAGGAQQAGKRCPAAGRVLACPPHPEGRWALEQCSPSQGHQPRLGGLRGLHPAGRTGCARCHPAEPCAGRGAWVLCPGARPQVKGLGAARGLSFVRRLQSPDAARPTHALCPHLPPLLSRVPAATAPQAQRKGLVTELRQAEIFHLAVL